ncbi:hypothetical protein K503DRAFT_498670 [Rhizopogon vinicolor AM-OR11-026]|uniref:Protein kinase domain-containing protein n=1 Tax=Rhizopogon vinicolor AM-OR11-026 TaxID=1314800 RepID=A0A1B7NHB6_9AGAM|nr:hypothetical protein K503DRAFT_498670 [Rhizopogon vinicolor AM-OR11-026]
MRSQPIPHPFRWNDPGILVKLYTVCLTGFGKAQWVNTGPLMRTLDPLEYTVCAPEVILQVDCGVNVEIWSLGCMTFKLLTGYCLAHPQASQTYRDHLVTIAKFTAEDVSDELLAKFRMRVSAIFSCDLPEAGVASAVAFIRACCG